MSFIYIEAVLSFEIQFAESYILWHVKIVSVISSIIIAGVWGNLGVIVVQIFEPVFRNLPHSYTWPLKKTDPFIYMY